MADKPKKNTTPTKENVVAKMKTFESMMKDADIAFLVNMAQDQQTPPKQNQVENKPKS